MNSVLYGYSVSGATWMYLSALLIVGVYFRFNRLWSRRNLDLLLLLALQPGLLLIREPAARVAGYTVLLCTSVLILVRVLLDPFAKWRPRFEQNMNSAGMLWLSCCALLFLGTRAIVDQIPSGTEETVARADQLLTLRATDPIAASPAEMNAEVGPAPSLVAAPVTLMFEQFAAPTLAIIAHLAVAAGLLYIGRRVFDDAGSGVAMVALYLLLPCTAYRVGEVNHVLPAAFLLWAVALWKRPTASGSLVAMACGTLVFPVFLVPLWVSFYGRRGWKPFTIGFVATAVVLFGSFALISRDWQQFVEQTTGVMQHYRTVLEAPVREATSEVAADLTSPEATEFWQASSYWEPYRLPVVAIFAVLLVVMTAWPRPKTLELLLAQQTAAILAVQFWLPDHAGTYVLWYLPLLIALMFRLRLSESYAGEDSEQLASRRNRTPAKSPSVPATAKLL